MSGKGQMSFDMAFAVILILVIFATLAGYYNNSLKAASDTGELAALTAIADYTAGNLQALYNSLAYAPDGSKANYTLELKGDTMYGNSDKPHIVEYTASLGSMVSFTSASDAGKTFTVQRRLGFNFNSGCGELSPGTTVTLIDCDAGTRSLNCDDCTIT